MNLKLVLFLLGFVLWVNSVESKACNGYLPIAHQVAVSYSQVITDRKTLGLKFRKSISARIVPENTDFK